MPECGERRVQVYFEVLGEPRVRTAKTAASTSKASRRVSSSKRSEKSNKHCEARVVGCVSMPRAHNFGVEHDKTPWSIDRCRPQRAGGL
jgi:hypothetical protein